MVPPTGQYEKANADGSARGKPGPAGYGLVFRDQLNSFVMVQVQGLRVLDNFSAEVIAILEAIEIAIEQGWAMLWVESDSVAAVSAFTSNSVPWQYLARWRACKVTIFSVVITHIWKEGNLAADQRAKRGSSLQKGVVQCTMGRLEWLTKCEVPFGTYYRFS